MNLKKKKRKRRERGKRMGEGRKIVEEWFICTWHKKNE